MSTFKVHKSGEFTVMSNHHLKNRSLSLKAKGLLSVILSLPDGWDYSISGLAAISLESKTAIQSAVKELEKSGYISRKRMKCEDGKFYYEYSVFEAPVDESLPRPCFPFTEDPCTEDPCTENVPQYNIKESNIKEYNIKNNNIILEQFPMILSNGKEKGFSQQIIDLWKKTYSLIDVEQELKKMQSWCLSNPQKRKTASGITRFANSWLARAQEQAKAKQKPQIRYESDDIFSDLPELELEEV